MFIIALNLIISNQSFRLPENYAGTKNMNKQLLKDKTILITGASSGVGEAVAFACAENGATVVLLGRNNKRLENIYDKIVQAGLPEPYAISFDLNTANDAEFNALAETIFQQTKRMDGIVHSASYFYALSPLEFQTVDEWVNQYRINTVAPMALTRAFLPLFRRQGGSIVFIGESILKRQKPTGQALVQAVVR